MMDTTIGLDHFVNVAGRLERLPMTRYQRILFAIICTAWFFDSLDLAMLTFVLGSIKASLSLTTAETGFLASASFIGMLIGAGVAGLLADRFGRRPVFQWSMVFWGLGSLMCGLSSSYRELVGYRVLLGFGMGMEFPIGLALLSELLPTSSRGRYIAVLEGVWPIGFICAGLIAFFGLEVVGWKGIFIGLAFPALFVFVIRRSVPESPRWLENSGRLSEAEKVISGFEGKVLAASGLPRLPEVDQRHRAPVPQGKTGFAELWAGEYLKRTIMVWSLWFFALLGYYGLTTWLGAMLQAAGYEVLKSVSYTIMISLAGIPGFIFAAWLIEFWGRKPSCILMLVGSGVFASVYGFFAASHAPLYQLIPAGACMQFFLFGMWCVLYAYTPELYPTRIRATGAGFASSIGRLGALSGPIIVGNLLPVVGQQGIFGLGACSFIVAAAAVLIFGVETKGKTLEELSN